jgi:hypothetical protein
MFCGWRQIFSKRRLVDLGSGVLSLDVLRGQCTFAATAIEPLPILAELRAWMVKDFADNRIPLDEIDQAEVVAQLEVTTIEWEARKTNAQYFLPSGLELKGGPMYRCRVECTSTVRSGDAVYRGKYFDTEEWPVGWPAA